MSWAVIARKDFQDAVRSRMLVALTVLFILFTAGFTYLYNAVPVMAGDTSNGSTVALLSALTGAGTLVVPLIGLVIGYTAIVGERESGSLKFLLGLPHTRRDVMLGKLVGRTAVVTVSILIGFAAAALVVLVFYDSFAVAEFAIYMVVTVLLGLVFVAIAIGFSAGMRSTSWALYGAVGLFVLFQFVWNYTPVLVLYVANGFVPPDMTTAPEWVSVITLFNPQHAYMYAAAAVIPNLAELLSITTERGDPFYLQEWFGFVVFVLWTVVPLGLGYLRFNSTDL